MGLLPRQLMTRHGMKKIRSVTSFSRAFVDEDGRRMRRQPINNNNEWNITSSSDTSSSESTLKQQRRNEPRRNEQTNYRRKESRDEWNKNFDDNDNDDEFKSRPSRNRAERNGYQRDSSSRRFDKNVDRTDSDRKMNLKALERAGFDHLYGLASVSNALEAGMRDFSRPEDLIRLEDISGEQLEHEMKQRARKPEAQFSPWLFVQQKSSSSSRSLDKAAQAAKVLRLAEQRGIPVATVDKGVLNILSGNRPHQGYILRCGKRFFPSISKLPFHNDDTNSNPPFKPFWLVLDEVVDPQNFGALLRSTYFLGNSNVGVLVCAKNSAPPTAVVSAASAGALELMEVYSTGNLPRTLADADQAGFRIIGASSSVPKDVIDVPLYDLQDLSPLDDRPTVLVMGSEGHGLRSLVARFCTEFVRISPGNQNPESGNVDSLNVSVTGGILLWRLLRDSSSAR
jgi:21S rRNA (GM2251-2'-O)-methyltransferase